METKVMAGKCPSYSIILAGGKGSRMGSNSIPKVCFKVDGVPAINRAINCYNACGIAQHVVVTGVMAEQVVETVGKEFSNVVFAFQKDQSGTANAVRTAFDALKSLDGNEEVLIVAGDRIIEQPVLEKFFNLYYTNNCALALLALPRTEGSGSGRIICDENSEPLEIIEMADIRQRRTLRTLRTLAEKGELKNRRQTLDLMIKNFSDDEKKLSIAFGMLYEYLRAKENFSNDKMLSLIDESSTYFTVGGKILTPEDAEQSPWCNTSVYLGRCSALREALGCLRRDNAQHEEYLPDIVKILKARDLKIKALKVDTPDLVMGFNNPAELLEVEKLIEQRHQNIRQRVKLPQDQFLELGDWRNHCKLLAAKDPGEKAFAQLFSSLYSADDAITDNQLERFSQLLKFCAGHLDSKDKICLVRSPGRVNVMGRHIDHQGGNCNLMTIGYETLMAVRPREDDTVRLFNTDPAFKGTEFKISDLVADLPWDDWLSLVNSAKLAELISNYGVDWSHYIKAAVLRLQKKFNHTKLRGMDIFVSGNIPMAAGLSSSSSLVVGTAEAVVAVNSLNTFPAQLVTLCGEGEWFVGTRGGSADHAAVKFGEKGKVVKVRFFDFAIERIVDFPEGHVMALCDSGIKARKSSNAKDQFNHRICCYRIGFMLIKKFFPQYAPLLQHLRDVNVRNLRIPLSWIYRILLHLPEAATLPELQKLLPDEDLKALCANHTPPPDGIYPIRGVVLFGLSEFERARLYADYLEQGKLEEIGALMRVSHDGDRVSVRDDISGRRMAYRAPDSNAYLLSLIENLESGDPQRVIQSQLELQSGSYHCSLEQIDEMVDISLKTPGVIGAQLAGAGLGGCMMVFARSSAIDKLVANLEQQYYKPGGRKPSVLVCKPVAGCGIMHYPGDE